jgi:hypothetical protein
MHQSFLDRANIGNAKIEGLQDDLHLSDGQYNACLTIFFVSYSVFEPVTNILLKRFKPSRFIPLIMLLWVSSSLHFPTIQPLTFNLREYA